MTLISVVLCTRNGARHLREQLESISAGSRSPDEVIILDDDSSDDSLHIAEEWAQAHPAVSARIDANRPALGVTGNFERGIRMARGDVIVLCDQDDRWRPDRIERAVELLAEPGTLLSHGNASLIDDAGQPLGATLFDYLGVSPSEREAELSGRGFDVLLRRNTVTGATTAFASSLRGIALPIPEGWIHDEWLAIIAAAQRGLVLDPGIRVNYRLHGSNQIGAERPTLRHRIRRAVTREAGRSDRLARRSRQLLDRLGRGGFSDEAIRRAEAKAEFEAARAALPRARVLRIPRVLRLLGSGAYSVYASRGRWDVVRDLLQPR